MSLNTFVLHTKLGAHHYGANEVVFPYISRVFFENVFFTKTLLLEQLKGFVFAN